MKSETKRRKRSRAVTPIRFPRPVVAASPRTEVCSTCGWPSRTATRTRVEHETLCSADPTPKAAIAPLPKEGIIDHLIVLRTWSNDEEKVLDPRRFPEYGLEKIPVSTTPFQLTLERLWRRLVFTLRAPEGTRRSSLRRRQWVP